MHALNATKERFELSGLSGLRDVLVKEMYGFFCVIRHKFEGTQTQANAITHRQRRILTNTRIHK
jgi:hypothetical protein